MRKLVEAVVARLRAFLDQRDDLALVVRCPETETALILKLLEGLQDSATSELFWIFAEPFTTPAAYLAALTRTLATRHEAVRAGQAKAGMTPWPIFPPALEDEKL